MIELQWLQASRILLQLYLHNVVARARGRQPAEIKGLFYYLLLSSSYPLSRPSERETRSRRSNKYHYEIHTFIAAIYVTSCYGMWSCKRVGIIKKTNDSQQLRGNNNEEEIGRVKLCDRSTSEELMKVEEENVDEGWKLVYHKVGESIWFNGTSLPPNCTDSDETSSCNIILSDSPTCHDKDAFQKSKTIRQMHYITDHTGSTNDVWLQHEFPGLPAFSDMATTVHFTDQNGARVACAILESEEDSETLLDDDSFYTKDITKKVVAASHVEQSQSRFAVDSSKVTLLVPE